MLDLSILLNILLALIDSVVSLSSSPRTSAQSKDAFVNLGYGSFQGDTIPLGVNQYLGIPFAAPPIGDLRWRAPVDPIPLHTVQNATSFKPICLGSLAAFPSTTQSEDCLYLNVWAPKGANSKSKLPVWFYIQGGGYRSNGNANYNGSNLVEKSDGNVVLVNFNYRVGAFGFLASEKIRKNGDLNVGLLDQRKALQWVQEYIHLFGGDPHSVVIHGTSAGAGSVALHLTAYGGRDDKLFVGAIAESLFFPRQPRVAELEYQFDRFAEGAGCGNSSDQVSCLRALDTASLQASNRPSTFIGATGQPVFYWAPTVDGHFTRDYPYLLFEKGAFIKVPVLFGNTNDEGSYYASNATSQTDIATFMHNNYPLLSQADLDDINVNYPLLEPLPKHAAYFPSASRAYGEAVFVCPAITILQSFSRYSRSDKIWAYRYNVQDDENIQNGLGVPHTFELDAIFGPGFAGGFPASYATYNKQIVPVIRDYFISFVRSLNPNAHKNKDARRWETYGDIQRRLKMQTNATEMETTTKAQLYRCAFWKELGIERKV